MISACLLLLQQRNLAVSITLQRITDVMQAKALLFALFLTLFSLSGCIASFGGPDYGYYPPARSYYGYPRPYYAPRPIIIVPQRGYYRGGNGYRGDGGYRDGGYRGGGYGGSHGHRERD